MSAIVNHNSSRHGGGAWAPLEPTFANIRELWRQGVNEVCVAMQTHFEKVEPIALGTARGLFSHYELPIAEAEEAWRRWQLETLKDGLNRCDNRPLYRYAKGRLRCLCTQMKREATRFRSLPSGHDAADDRFNPFRDASRNDIIHGVRHAMRNLNPRQRSVLVQQHFEQLSAEESAAKEGISVKRVYNLRFRGSEALRRELAYLHDPELS